MRKVEKSDEPAKLIALFYPRIISLSSLSYKRKLYQTFGYSSYV